jgi:hypothetical protein
VGGGFDKEDSHASTSKDTSDLSVSFKFVRVDIARPWLNFLREEAASTPVMREIARYSGGEKLYSTFPAVSATY